MKDRYVCEFRSGTLRRSTGNDVSPNNNNGMQHSMADIDAPVATTLCYSTMVNEIPFEW
jgi:hypothetical protein